MSVVSVVHAMASIYTKVVSACVIIFSIGTGPALSLTLEKPADGIDVVGHRQTVTVEHGDSFSSIARRFGVGFDALAGLNPNINPWYPLAGTVITLPTQHVLPEATAEGIVINLAELRLYFFPQQSDRVYVYPVGIGRAGWETPLADTVITRIDHNPVWRPPQSIREEYQQAGLNLPDVVPAGPDNPLGAIALRLELPGYLLHGTNRPEGVGMRVSHGCIRLYPEHIRELSTMVEKGTRVQIINQPIKWGRSDQGLVVEAYKDRTKRDSTVARSYLVGKSKKLSLWLQKKQSEQTLFIGTPVVYR